MTTHKVHMTKRLQRLMVATGALLLPLAGCGDLIDDIVEVTPRDQIDPGALGTADGATAMYNGAIDAISISFSGNNGGTEGIAMMGGMMADEWYHSGTFNTRESYDRREERADNGTVGGVMRRLHTARIAAARAHDALVETGSSAASDARVPEMKAIEALTYILGAETFCNGMPFSSVVDGVIVGGDPLTNADAFNIAIDLLDEALSGAPGTGNVIANFARVLKARALMNLGKGNFGAAASILSGVPDNFQYLAYHSTQGNRNGIFVFNTQNERFSIAHNEGINGLPFRGAGNGTDESQADPRIPWTRTGGGTDVGFDNASPQYDVQKWLTFDDEVVIASGLEARLMEAEALLNSGGNWLGTLNALRQTVAGLAPLTDPGTATAREDLLFRERAFWLFGEGHRLGDLRRLVRQYNRGTETVFPTGTFFKNGLYGPDVAFPINVIELNNTAYAAANSAGQLNVRGCLDDSA